MIWDRVIPALFFVRLDAVIFTCSSHANRFPFTNFRLHFRGFSSWGLLFIAIRSTFLRGMRKASHYVVSFFTYFSNIPLSLLFSSHFNFDFLCFAVIIKKWKYGFIQSGAGQGRTATVRERELLREVIKEIPATSTSIFECGRNVSRTFSMLIASTPRLPELALCHACGPSQSHSF